MLIIRSAKGVLDGKRHFLSVTDMGLLHSACLTIRMRGRWILQYNMQKEYYPM